MKTKELCVYKHYISNPEEPFYIGAGSLLRATNTSTRSSKWMDVYNQNGKVFKHEIYPVKNRDEAQKLEGELIEKYKSFLCNNIEKKNRKTPVANPCLPKLKRILSNLGENIKLARLRRQWSAQMLGDRAGCTRYTIAAVESGAENVAIGVYLNILFVFGFEKELECVAQKDPVGRLILDARMLSGRAK